MWTKSKEIAAALGIYAVQLMYAYPFAAPLFVVGLIGLVGLVVWLF